jgi:pimeloyl-ACP methyl ester carboxylesterase
MSLTHKTTSNEGCILHFTTILLSAEDSIKKPLLILVRGDSGYSTQFLPILPYFTTKLEPVTYSRRQQGLSTPEPGTSEVYLNIAQPARNLLTIASGLGFGSEKLYLFCSSGVSITAFQLAVSYPNRIAHMIAHEAGTVGLLTDSEKYIDIFHQVYSLNLTQEKEAAHRNFRRFMSTGYEDADTIAETWGSSGRRRREILIRQRPECRVNS